MAGGVFINYRGDDSHSHAALLYVELSRKFGRDRAFLDSESVPAGSDFTVELLDRVRRSRVLLAVIGPHWLNVRRADGRRHIDDPNDWIRRELAKAFAAGVAVIPVLTDDSTLPDEADLPADIAPLARCKYRMLRHRDTDADLARILRDIAEAAPDLRIVRKRTITIVVRKRTIIGLSIVWLLMVLSVLITYAQRLESHHPSPSGSPRCDVRPSPANPTTVKPDTGTRLVFLFSDLCDPNTARLSIAPTTGVTKVLARKSGPLEWLVSFPKGEYRYTVAVSGRRFKSSESTVDGVIFANRNSVIRDTWEWAHESLSSAWVESSKATFHPERTSNITISLHWTQVRPPSDPDLIPVAELKICPQFSLTMQQTPECSSETVSLDPLTDIELTWLLSPQKEGDLTTTLRVTLTPHVSGSEFAVSESRFLYLGKVSKTNGQHFHDTYVALTDMAQSWPAIAACVTTIAGCIVWLISRLRRKSQEEAEKLHSDQPREEHYSAPN